MVAANLNITVRKPVESVCVIDLKGEINSFAERSLMDACTGADNGKTGAIVLNFSEVEYMNSSGIGLLVTLLIRVQRQKQKLIAYGLSDHYRQIFKLTRLDEAIQVYENEREILAAAG